MYKNLDWLSLTPSIVKRLEYYRNHFLDIEVVHLLQKGKHSVWGCHQHNYIKTQFFDVIIKKTFSTKGPNLHPFGTHSHRRRHLRFVSSHVTCFSSLGFIYEKFPRKNRNNSNNKFYRQYLYELYKSWEFVLWCIITNVLDHHPFFYADCGKTDCVNEDSLCRR